MRRSYVLRRSRAADWARICGGLAVPVLVLAAIGTRVSLVPTAALVPVLAVGFLLGLAALGVAIYALTDVWKNGATGGGAAIAGIVYALPTHVLLGVIAAAAITYPRLTDVSTSVAEPPEFIAAASQHRSPPGEGFTQQQDAYPDIITRFYPMPLGDVYAAAREIIEGRGWTITRDSRPTVMPEASPEAEDAPASETEDILRALAQKSVMTQSRGTPLPPGAEAGGDQPLLNVGSQAIIEATAPTLVFGFPDDVVIRMRGSFESTDVDMRSASRSGQHDLGQNARRIRWFFGRLDAALQLDPDARSSSGLASFGR